MPIYDNNGTTSYEIGKVYDNDGTTSYEIGKVYDNDGTASHLIYSAEETLFPEQYSAWKTQTSGKGSNALSVTSSKITVITSASSGTEWNNGNYAAAYSPVVDFSQYSTLKITYSKLIQNTEYGTRAKSILGVLADGASFTVYDNNGCYDNANWLWKQDYVSNFQSLAGTYTYNISNLKTSGRLWLMSYNIANWAATMEVTEIVLE